MGSVLASFWDLLGSKWTLLAWRRPQGQPDHKQPYLLYLERLSECFPRAASFHLEQPLLASSYHFLEQEILPQIFLETNTFALLDWIDAWPLVNLGLGLLGPGCSQVAASAL